jgi:putative transposase
MNAPDHVPRIRKHRAPKGASTHGRRSTPGKPTDNAFIEAFNGRLRAECLSAHWFLSLADAREKLEAWRRYYNEERPHGAIGYNVPIALMNGDGPSGRPSP